MKPPTNLSQDLAEIADFIEQHPDECDPAYLASIAADMRKASQALVAPQLAHFGNPDETCSPQYFIRLSEIYRSSTVHGDWIVFYFHEGGTVRVPVGPDDVCVFSEPERH